MRHRRLGLVHLLERHPGHGAGPHLVGESVGRLESAEGGGLLVLLSVGGGQALVEGGLAGRIATPGGSRAWHVVERIAGVVVLDEDVGVGVG